jgi:uncharacterized protein (DUF2225 family)
MRKAVQAAPVCEYTTLALRCPVCGTQFTSELPDPGVVEGRDTDLRPRFRGPDLLPSLIHTCPSCLYTAYRRGYEGWREEGEEELELARAPGDRLPPRLTLPEDEELEDLRRWIRRGDLKQGLAAGREHFGAERYVLGARCYDYVREDDPVGSSDYHLRASWCARAEKNRELELGCQIEVVAKLLHGLEHSLIRDADKPRTLYLIGELSRRTGDFARAVDLFTQLETASESEEDEAALFGYLARRQFTLAVVKSDIEATLTEDDLAVLRELDPRRDDGRSPRDDEED